MIISSVSPRRLLGVALLIAALSLAGCGRSGAAFRPIDAAVGDIEPAGIGNVIADVRSGGRPLSQPATRRVTLRAVGETADLEEQATVRLRGAGFTQTGPTGWSRGTGANYVRVFVNLVTSEGADTLVLTFTRST